MNILPARTVVSPTFTKLIAFTREKIVNNINVVVRRQVKEGNGSLPVAVRGSKMSRA